MANPTTNYGWPMPTATDLVTDLPADFAAFGQPVDTSLKALNPETTLGDIAYRSATANTNTRLPIGSTGNVLTVAGGVPSWAAPAGGGKVLQVVNATYSTLVTSSSTTYADTGLTATITPTLATSKILVLISQQMQKNNANAGNAYYTRTLRGGTTILEHKDLLYTGTLIYNLSMYSVNILDNPATTSATTYKTQLANYVAAASVSAQENNSTSSMTLLEIGV